MGMKLEAGKQYRQEQWWGRAGQAGAVEGQEHWSSGSSCSMNCFVGVLPKIFGMMNVLFVFKEENTIGWLRVYVMGSCYMLYMLGVSGSGKILEAYACTVVYCRHSRAFLLVYL